MWWNVKRWPKRVQHGNWWFLSLSGLALTLLWYRYSSVAGPISKTTSGIHSSIPAARLEPAPGDLPRIRKTTSGVFFSIPTARLEPAPAALPRMWERPPQFLDKVEAFRITNEDPLAMTFSVLPPDKTHSGDAKPTQGGHVHKSSDAVGNMLSNTHREFKKNGKRILVANHPNWNWIRMAEIGLKDCPVKCSLTDDHTEMQTADAIIFYAVGMSGKPPPRPAGQIWIFLALEASLHSYADTFNTPVWHDQINWTMTYRHDSDIFYPYGRVNRRKDNLATNYTALAEKKSRAAAWFVSHCFTFSKREVYVKKLQKYIGVDIFGSCGPKKCGVEGTYECFEMLTNNYKFYLSFENALCEDYVTEKLYRQVMVADIVPIVFGRVNYTRYMPPKSFINVDDFDSVASLARYLDYLDKNVTAYAEYLEWKRYYFVVEKPNPTCEVCMKLTEPEKYKHVYKDVFSWWSAGQCKTPQPVV